MLLVSASGIKPPLVDAPVRNWWAGKKIRSSSGDRSCQQKTLKASHQPCVHKTPLGIWVTPSRHAKSRASKETGGAKGGAEGSLKRSKNEAYIINCTVMHPLKLFFPRCFQRRVRSACIIRWQLMSWGEEIWVWHRTQRDTPSEGLQTHPLSLYQGV